MIHTNTEVTNILDSIAEGGVPVNSGTLSKPTIAYNTGLGTVTIGDGTYRMYKTTDYTGGTFDYDIAGTTLAVADDTTSYLIAEYNAGTPRLVITTDISSVNDSYACVVYTIYRNGDSISVIDWNEPGKGMGNKIHRRLIETERFATAVEIQIGEYGTRNVTLSAGAVWQGCQRNTLEAVDSAVDTCYQLTNNGDTTYAYTPVTAYNNTQYDLENGSLGTLTDGNYGVLWVYRSMDHDSKRMYLRLGVGDYTLNDAKATQPPDIHSSMTTNGLLIGRIIVLKGAATATQIDSAFDTKFSASTTTDHAGLTGLEGGDETNHYHFPLSEFANAKGFNAKLYNVSTQVFETAVVNREYYSPDQHGGIYGTVYRRYHNTAVNGGYISIPGITKLVDYGGTLNGDNVYHGFAGDGTSHIHLYRGTDRVTFSMGGWGVTTGWVDYAK